MRFVYRSFWALNSLSLAIRVLSTSWHWECTFHRGDLFAAFRGAERAGQSIPFALAVSQVTVIQNNQDVTVVVCGVGGCPEPQKLHLRS